MTSPMLAEISLFARKLQTLVFNSRIVLHVAFANLRGDSVFVKVNDGVDILSIMLCKEALNKCLGQIKSAINPAHILNIEMDKIKGKAVVVVQVSDFLPSLVNSDRYFKWIVVVVEASKQITEPPAWVENSKKILTLLQVVSGIKSKVHAKYMYIMPRAVEKKIEKFKCGSWCQRIDSDNVGCLQVKKIEI